MRYCLKAIVCIVLVCLAALLDWALMAAFWLPVRIVWGKNTFDAYVKGSNGFTDWLINELD